MGYRVLATKSVKGIRWRVLHESWEGGKRHDRHIANDQLLAHGFPGDLTVEQARERAKQLNAVDGLRKQEERKKVLALRAVKGRERLVSAHLPESLCAEFEEQVLKRKFAFGRNSEKKFQKVMCRWVCGQKAIIAVNRDTSVWFDVPESFYSYFAKHEFSLDYTCKVLSLINLWGHFISRRQGKAFLPISSPRGHYRELIADAYSDSGKRSKESAPLLPATLAKAEGRLLDAQFNWLRLSLWFGLRPIEIDNLTANSASWRIEERVNAVDGTTVTVLCIYQTKLTSISKEKRWKYIPVILPEQEACLPILRDGLSLKRPLVQSVKKHIAHDLTLYGGRKGFTDLMLGYGQKLEDISEWLGHKSIDMTFKIYKNKNNVRFSRVAC